MLSKFDPNNDIITTKIDAANPSLTITTATQATASAIWIFSCTASASGVLRIPDSASSVGLSTIPASSSFRHIANYFFGKTSYIENATNYEPVYGMKVIQIGRPTLDEGLYPGTITASICSHGFSMTSSVSTTDCSVHIYDVPTWSSANSALGLTGYMKFDKAAPETVMGYQIGTVFYDHGIIILHGNYWSDTKQTKVFTDTSSCADFRFNIDGSTTAVMYPLLPEGVRLVSLKFATRNVVKRNVFFCRAYNKEFNYTTNPTARNNEGYLIGSLTSDPTTFITTIGLYDDAGNLLAVGKVNPAKKKDAYSEALFRVVLDF